MANLTFDDLPMLELAQAAFSEYVEAAQNKEVKSAHDRLWQGSVAAAQAVVGNLRDLGYMRSKLLQQAAHGTPGGSSTGCRCEFCTEAKNLAARSNRHWKAIQGHNKVVE